MSVKGVGRGGKSGGAGRAGAASGPAKTSGAGFGGKVDKAESLVGPSGAAGSSNVQGTAPTDAITAQVLDIARQLKDGQLKSRDEATKKLVSDILREKVRMQSKQLTEKIVDQLKDDPRLSQTLDRLWKRAEEKE